MFHAIGEHLERRASSRSARLGSVPCVIGTSLPLERPPQEIVDRLARLLAIVQNLAHLGADRQIHAEPLREIVRAAGRRHALGDVTERAEDLCEWPPTPELQTHGSVTG